MLRSRSAPPVSHRSLAAASYHGPKNFVDRFMKLHYADVRCTPGNSATHLKLVGGKYCLPANKETQFLLEYSKDAGNAALCMTEVTTPTFPFFIDIDAFFEGASPGQVRPDIALEWARVAARAVAACVDDNERQASMALDPVNASVSAALRAALEVRDTMSPSTLVVTTAPYRHITKMKAKSEKRQKTDEEDSSSKVSGAKVGVHLIWPGLLVTKPNAQRLRAIVVTAMYDAMRGDGLNWDEVIDVSVYRKMSSLRMISSYKAKECDVCTFEDRKAFKREESTLRKVLAEYIGLDSKAATMYLVGIHVCASINPANVSNVRPTALTPEMRKNAVRYNTICKHSKSCTGCQGVGKVPDLSIGFYSPIAVIRADGGRDSEVEAKMEDSVVAVHICSVRRPHGETPVRITWPVHAPAAAPVEMMEVEGDDDDDTPRENIVRAAYSPPSEAIDGKLIKEVIDDDDSAVHNAIENFIRSGEMGSAYSNVLVASVYKLVAVKKKYSGFTDGGPYYTVVAAVRGTGAQFCQGYKGDHSVNHIYFEFRPDGTAVQKCRSVKRKSCEGACTPPTPFPALLYTSLFPYAQKALAVSDEEVNAWVSGRLPLSYLDVYLSRPATFCSRRDKGAQFKAIVSIGRRRLAREARTVRDGGEVAVAGKRRAEGAPSDYDVDVDDFVMDHFL
ncbi:hypothetical protein JKP88DRAFT_255177 [Tribonema minus]|uniref:C962R-like N-terminal AEP domain-containing protein n=1 Tax=Tribonema minus TaxID=303371 RepID=A0A835Z3P0_9STRA|nr:hypothetical protein JKP88DRAFT_255177 [Tribonema minus]